MSLKSEVKVSITAERPVNTRRLQIFELNLFMLNELHAIYDGVGFTDMEFGVQYSFNHAVKLFNEREDKDFGEKIVDTLKLRYCKHSKKILCTSHWIKATKGFEEACKEMEVPVFEGVLAVMNQYRLR